MPSRANGNGAISRRTQHDSCHDPLRANMGQNQPRPCMAKLGLVLGCDSATDTSNLQNQLGRENHVAQRDLPHKAM